MWQRDCEKLGLSDFNLPDLNDHILGTWGNLQIGFWTIWGLSGESQKTGSRKMPILFLESRK